MIDENTLLTILIVRYQKKELCTHVFCLMVGEVGETYRYWKSKLLAIDNRVEADPDCQQSL